MKQWFFIHMPWVFMSWKLRLHNQDGYFRITYDKCEGWYYRWNGIVPELDEDPWYGTWREFYPQLRCYLNLGLKGISLQKGYITLINVGQCGNVIRPWTKLDPIVELENNNSSSDWAEINIQIIEPLCNAVA